MSHTPTPWKINPWNGDREKEDFTIGNATDWRCIYRGPCSFRAISREDAEFLVEAVNNHDRLTAEVARLKLATLRAVDYFKARNLGDTAEELLKYLQEALNPEEPK